MKYTYEKVEVATLDKNAFCIERTDEAGNKVWIPNDPANSDYQRYLRWLENPDAEESGTL